MRYYLFFLAVFIGINTLSQNPSVSWQKTLGGTAIDFGLDVVVNESTQDIFVLGSSDSNIGFEKSENSKGGEDLWIVKLNNLGVIQWDKTIGGSDNDGGETYSLIVNQKIYVLTWSRSPVSGDKTITNYGLNDFWLLCFDFDGNVLWQQCYGGDQNDNPKKVLIKNNGNLLLFGQSSSSITGNKTDATHGLSDYWILEVDTISGAIVNQKSIGTSNFETAKSIVLDNSDNIYLMGYSNTGIDGDKTDLGYGASDVWLVKLASDFTILSDKCFGGSATESIYGDMLYRNNFIYVLASTSSPADGNKTADFYGGRDIWLIKIDLDLNLISDVSFGGTGFDDPTNIIAQPMNKLVITSVSPSPVSGNKTVASYGGNDIWMIITDLDGNEVQQVSYGGTLSDFPGKIYGKGDGNLIVVSSSNSNSSGIKNENSRGDYDFWVMSLDATDFLSNEIQISQIYSFNAYPNPFIDFIRFEFPQIDLESELNIYSVDGKLIFRTTIAAGESSFVWYPNKDLQGTFIAELSGIKGRWIKKIVRN